MPSGWPISASCANEPRWVWNSLPGVRVNVWCLPLASVSWTWSPAASGPRRRAAPVGSVTALVWGVGSVTADHPSESARLQSSYDVVGHQHAQDGSRRVDHEVLGRGRGPHRVQQRLTGEPRLEDESGVE